MQTLTSVWERVDVQRMEGRRLPDVARFRLYRLLLSYRSKAA